MKRCPKCNSTNVSITGTGVTEKGIRFVGGMVAGIAIGMFSQHAGHHVGTEIMNGGTSEYKCNNCGHVFQAKNKD